MVLFSFLSVTEAVETRRNEQWTPCGRSFLIHRMPLPPAFSPKPPKRESCYPVIYIYIYIYMCVCVCVYIYIYLGLIYIYTRIIKCFHTFFVWALLLIVHTWNSRLLRSNLLRLQCIWCTVPTTSARPHRSPLVWACQWPSSQPLSSQLSHNNLWA